MQMILSQTTVTEGSVQVQVVCLEKESSTGVTRSSVSAYTGISVHRRTDASLWNHHI